MTTRWCSYINEHYLALFGRSDQVPVWTEKPFRGYVMVKTRTKKSRSRKAPRKQNMYSLANKVVANRMSQSKQGGPEEHAAALALLDRTNIETIADVATLDELSRAANVLADYPAGTYGNYWQEFQALQEKFRVVHDYRNRINERRDILTRKEARRAVA